MYSLVSTNPGRDATYRYVIHPRAQLPRDLHTPHAHLSVCCSLRCTAPPHRTAPAPCSALNKGLPPPSYPDEPAKRQKIPRLLLSSRVLFKLIFLLSPAKSWHTFRSSSNVQDWSVRKPFLAIGLACRTTTLAHIHKYAKSSSTITALTPRTVSSNELSPPPPPQTTTQPHITSNLAFLGTRTSGWFCSHHHHQQ